MALKSFKFLADFTELDLPVILLAIPIAARHSILEPGARAKWFETMTTRRPARAVGETDWHHINSDHKMKSVL